MKFGVVPHVGFSDPAGTDQFILQLYLIGTMRYLVNIDRLSVKNQSKGPPLPMGRAISLC